MIELDSDTKTKIKQHIDKWLSGYIVLTMSFFLLIKLYIFSVMAFVIGIIYYIHKKW